MAHPLVRLLATEPHLLAEHLGDYASLVAQEAGQARAQWMLRLTLTVLSVVCAAIALVLAGVAVMLWAVHPQLDSEASWALCAAPSLPAVAALLAGLWARRPVAVRAFAAVQEQVQADLALLRELVPQAPAGAQVGPGPASSASTGAVPASPSNTPTSSP